MESNELFSIGQHALAAQSFSRLLGTKLMVFQPGEVVLELPVHEKLLQQNGFVHGGVLSYAADNALTFVGGSVLGPNVLTSEYKINYPCHWGEARRPWDCCLCRQTPSGMSL
ncbi:uncharacterized domain 1-containing protein [Aneurinibacillus thermoaerophilus]|uniref:Uncharacterized domain 1-containing protein n=1 Tax=Aneurinibacillus thermoaerophilus TaxID=143495 RepID=A0A1G7YCY6_ANETH|nr:PaaI family thioesterase [Aneurinibacillus thermoaerophilus]SDG94179.1 uncharacterized domain 1-containing protein [Aneurinibacillus thermoaerophilus]